ncbi:hypothetical protein [Burkholderia sp. JP2-270]|uniref:hypothetical protein n=1 Tax=Burkholderia sp. JP2-270 TaxID=2217913 RepID=UPI001955184A|nr:hypothetical protein [Burkholderia sp. JP2-270]
MRPIRFRSFVPFSLRVYADARCAPLRAEPERAEMYLTPIRDNPRVHAHQGLRAVDASAFVNLFIETGGTAGIRFSYDRS